MRNLPHGASLTAKQCSGPLTVADFMRFVNTHPTCGYYSYKEAFGQRGDFVTAPEISQLFGEVSSVLPFVCGRHKTVTPPMLSLDCGGLHAARVSVALLPSIRPPHSRG